MQTEPPRSQPPTSASCLSESDVLVVLEGAASDPALQGLRAHLATCEACALLVSEVARAMRPPEVVSSAELAEATGAISSGWHDVSGALVVPGSVLNERFLLREPLGQGGMGVVVEAWDLQLSRLVAIKCLLATGSATSAQRARFQREALVLSKSAGAHVLQIFDAGICAVHGFPFLVMERLEGEDLAVRLRRGPSPTVAEACAIARAVARALAQAHAQGVVHRDLKPSNVFLLAGPHAEPQVKLLDFGISKVLSADSSAGDIQLTQSQVFLGTAAYAAPEQIRAPSGVTPAADVWSLGVVLYEMFYGQLPFRGNNLGDVLAGTLRETLVLPKRSDVPRALERLVLHTLDKDASNAC